MQKLFILISLIILITAAGCTSETPVVTPVPTDTSTAAVCSIDPQTSCDVPTSGEQPVLYGTWKGIVDEEPTTLTISETCVNLYFDNPGEQDDMEVHYEIQSVDWARDLLTLSLSWQMEDCVKQEVEGIGAFMKVWVNENQLFYTINDIEPAEALVGPLVKE